MNPYRGYAQRQNIPRQNVRLLNPEIRTKTRRRERRASIAIIGYSRAGKKTLAYRFGAMNEGPFEEEIASQYDYVANINLDTREINGTGDLIMRSYVVPPPEDLPREFPPRYFRAIHHFAVLVFICSVVDKSSFVDIVMKFTT
ncbi:hypothetical protein HNY73_019624 [Argiope bruennichi]|uniref:Uncharacterized protein n=1 Tax=Argiope bruennichi TaxID=94029 RepID=A0A8T0E8I4_ARGBR|nr:hypothetical protein HNY73_019624 [Argiope bruennichi]